MQKLRNAFNRGMDRLVRREARIWGKPRSIFRVCGCIGLAAAALLAGLLTAHRGLSLWVTAAAAAAALFTFLAAAIATKLILGHERLVCFHHQIAVGLAAAGLLRLLGQPVLAYLDVTVLGVGLFLVCGRAGCLTAGCCHGRPH